MTKYRKKPVVIDAMPVRYFTTTKIGETQSIPHNYNEILEWINSNSPGAATLAMGSSVCAGGMCTADIRPWITIKTLEGEMTANNNDFIIKGVSGEFYPCKPDIFALTYEEVK